MDSALKQLKVNDLKRILADTGISANARAKKDDLVTRIIQSPDAVALFRARYLPDTRPQPIEPATEPAAAPTTSAPAPAPAQVIVAVPTSVAEPVMDAVNSELEKRKARAARFGIPFVNPPPDAKEKRKARAKRFGIDNDKTRPTADQVDLEELEKRRKRTERFGTKSSDASS